MFFSLFWTAYIPICMIILALAGEQLMHSFRRLGVHASQPSRNLSIVLGPQFRP